MIVYTTIPLPQYPEMRVPVLPVINNVVSQFSPKFKILTLYLQVTNK